MKALVLGGGVAGITTAYELLKDGWDVTVLERLEQPALFTSFANAGLVAPGHAYTWSSPAAPKILLKSLYRNDQALRFRPSLDPALWRWMWKFMTNCTAEKAKRNTMRKFLLCRYSQSLLIDVVAAAGVKYDGLDGGLLYLYRTPETFEAGKVKAEILQSAGADIDVLSPAAVGECDPVFTPAIREQIAGALFAKTDASGDARMFTQGLADVCRSRGATIKFSTEVTGFETEGRRVTGVRTKEGLESADHVVLSLGVYSPQLARQLGIDLPIYPVKGYSMTIPMDDPRDAPRLGGVDEDNLMAFCPMGSRVRLTATAEFVGYSTTHKPSDFRHMTDVAKALFPKAGDYAKAEYWAGLRPMTPEGSPVFGRGEFENFWLNTGHGHMGWTMACGAARICADLIADRQPAIDLDGMLYGK